MLKNLENLVRENAQSAIVDNSEIPNDKNEAAIEAASTSIIDVLRQKIAAGDINGLISSFKDPSAQGATSNEVENNFTSKLQDMGINLESAKAVAASIIPGILAKFNQKTNDPSDNSFDFQDIVAQVAGPDGKFQLSDLTNLFNNKGGDTTSSGDQKGENDGGFIDKMKDMF
ncbi:hypothetical protein [Albibacterium indicum]|uniref:hypothetical protein n=1 Tax=Albibacterium indicum TaxID=2292082 RepID=UPI000E49D1D0|nr:hypothetical protein [Pedobacter indicus]